MPTARAKLTSKGQITIPLEVRKRLGIRQGDLVEFDTAKPEIVIRPVRAVEDPFREMARRSRRVPGWPERNRCLDSEMRGRDEDED